MDNVIVFRIWKSLIFTFSNLNMTAQTMSVVVFSILSRNWACIAVPYYSVRFRT